jgi:hypothetical protein
MVSVVGSVRLQIQCISLKMIADYAVLTGFCGEFGINNNVNDWLTNQAFGQKPDGCNLFHQTF